MDELVDNCPTIPSGALKEQFLVLFESNERSMKVLPNVLKINIVRELVRSYEECHGQVSLDTWKYVFQQLGYSKEHFQQLVSAYQMIPDATDIIADLEENGCGAQSISRVCPEWSLPPQDESLLKENLVEGAAKGDDGRDFSLQAAAENGPSHENDGIPSTVQSSLSQGSASTLGVVPVVENGRSHHENSTLAEIHVEGREENVAASSIQADHKQQSIDKANTPSRPTSPEAPRSTLDPVVTGQHRSHQNNAVAKPYPSGNGEESQKSGIPSKTATEDDCRAENDCLENNNGLYAELQKENESLQLNVSYLVQKLRKKELVCARLHNECNSLQQQLQECRGQFTQLQIINEEFERRLEESAELEDESQQLIRMIEEVCNWREQENNRLEEHIRQLDQRHDHANRCMEDLRSECQQLSEELQLAFNQMRDLQLQRVHNLEREREQVRLQDEERMAEAARAFNNAETDKVKRLKQKLAQEKSKRKTLTEKNRQLEAFVRELRSKEEGHFPSGGSGGSGEDDAEENSESSTTASSEVEDDEQFGLSNHNQQLSDSDGSNEDHGHLDDASTDAIES